MAQPTTIAQGTRIAGHIEAGEDVAVEGHVEGSITLSEVLTIGTTGVVHGDVVAREAVVEGVLVGTVRASGRVYLGADARVQANITTPLLVMADGAQVAGQLNVGVDDELAAFAAEGGTAATARSTTSATAASSAAARSTPVATSTTSARTATPSSVTARPAYTPPTTSYTRPTPTPAPAYTRPEPAPRPTAAPATAFEPGSTTTTVTTVEELAEEQSEPVEVNATPAEAPAPPEQAPEPEAQPDGEASNDVDRELFDELDEDYTVKELREELRRRDLPVTGTKAELIERLIQAEGSR